MLPFFGTNHCYVLCHSVHILPLVSFSFNLICWHQVSLMFHLLYIFLLIDGLKVDDETLELILPSGGRVGHRAFKHIYKQSFPPTQIHRNKERATIRGLNAQYKALGWNGTVSEAMKKTMITVKRREKDYQFGRLKLGVKANKFQPHFRAQVRF